MNSTVYPKMSAISTTSVNLMVSLASLFVIFCVVVGEKFSLMLEDVKEFLSQE